MEKIVDVLFTKKSIIRTKDPYSLALAVKEIASHYGHIKEKVHEYDTNGPRKVVKIDFDLHNPITRRTLSKMSFTMKGEIGMATSFLEVKVAAKTLTKIDVGTGVTSGIYGEYYLKSIFPLLRKESESRLRELSSAVEQDIKGILYKYA